MRALRLEATDNLQLLDLPPPTANDDALVIPVSHCALCRTDAKMWREGQRDLVLPRILGHEIVGEIDGALCAVWPGVACGSCDQCQRGAENLCRQMRVIGFHRDGGLAEQVVAPRENLMPLPEGLPAPLACLAEPLACGINALEQAAAAPGQEVLIYGGGRVGLLLALGTLSIGAKPCVCEIRPEKLDRSSAFRGALGIQAGAKPKHRDFDLAVNAAASLDTVFDGLQRLKAGGTFALFSGFASMDKLPAAVLNEVHYRQLHLVGAYGCTRDQMAKALEILARHVDVGEDLIEKEIGLDGVEEALHRVIEGSGFTYIVRPAP